MDEIPIGNCIYGFIFKSVENKLLFNKCNVIGNIQNTGNMKGKRHLKGVLRSRGEEEGCQEEK